MSQSLTPYDWNYKMNIKCWNCGIEMEKSEEEYWRKVISDEILYAVENSNANGFGAYLIAKGKR